MYKEDLSLNNQQWLICHKIKPNLGKRTTHYPPSFRLNSNTVVLLPGYF